MILMWHAKKRRWYQQSCTCYQSFLTAWQLDTSNGRCNVSECVQETFGRSVSEEGGFLYGLVVRKTVLAAGSFLWYCKMTLLMIAFRAAQPYQVRLQGAIMYYLLTNLLIIISSFLTWLLLTFYVCLRMCLFRYTKSVFAVSLLSWTAYWTHTPAAVEF